jgi:hypothetical protein
MTTMTPTRPDTADVAASTGSIRVFSPQSQRLITRRTITSLSSLEGITLGLLCNSKPNAQVLLDAVAEAISEQVNLAGIVRASKAIPSSAAPEETYATLAETCGAVIFASADCGSCTSWGIHDTAEMEKRGIPALCLVAHPFVPMANAQSVALEYPDLRTTVFEGPIAGIDEDTVRSKGRAIAASVIARLTA